MPFFEDPTGNIVVGVPSKAAYARLVGRKAEETPSASTWRTWTIRLPRPLMDRGGSSQGEVARASSVNRLIGAPVWIAMAGKSEVGGRIAAVKLAGSDRDKSTRPKSGETRRSSPATPPERSSATFGSGRPRGQSRTGCTESGR